MKIKYFVAAYATSPSHQAWDAQAESRYFQMLSEDSRIIGLEQPYCRDSEKYTINWLQENIPQHWNLIITALPCFMQEMQRNPKFGIASKSESDRKEAITLVEEIREYCAELQKKFNRNIVKAIHLHTAPGNKNGNLSDKESFRKSLKEIQSMEWGNIEINIEHCDAYIPGQQAGKGFLTLKDEMEIIEEIDHVGIVLNWARSVIECRSADGVFSHIKLAQEKKLLKGFFYSGCTNKKENVYGCWEDTHMPPILADCLLDKKEINKAHGMLQEDIYLGIKVADILRGNNPNKCADFNIKTIDFVEAAIIS